MVVDQVTASQPEATTVMPTMAEMMEWVEDTGSCRVGGRPGGRRGQEVSCGSSWKMMVSCRMVGAP